MTWKHASLEDPSSSIDVKTVLVAGRVLEQARCSEFLKWEISVSSPIAIVHSLKEESALAPMSKLKIRLILTCFPRFSTPLARGVAEGKTTPIFFTADRITCASTRPCDRVPSKTKAHYTCRLQIHTSASILHQSYPAALSYCVISHSIKCFISPERKLSWAQHLYSSKFSRRCALGKPFVGGTFVSHLIMMWSVLVCWTSLWEDTELSLFSWARKPTEKSIMDHRPPADKASLKSLILFGPKLSVSFSLSRTSMKYIVICEEQPALVYKT